MMQEIEFKHKNSEVVLALGPESEGNFCIYNNKTVFYFDELGNLLEDDCFENYKKKLNNFLEKNKIKPAVILTDLHPLFKTTELGKSLADKYKAKIFQVQHHFAHAFSAVFDDGRFPEKFVAITCDGTGYGLDEKIWGGEVLLFENKEFKRIGGLEEQKMIGGDLAINQPARMLLSILLKNYSFEETYRHVGKYFSKKDINVLVKQYREDFNCQTTTSTARILDAAAVLLGFSENKKEYKHQPAKLLEENSTQPYDLKPKITDNSLSTSHLFDYLIKNINKDKQRLAATVLMYLAEGLLEIAKALKIKDIFFAGGISANKTMAEYMQRNNVILNKNIPPGDRGISIGQLAYYLSANTRN